jgi:hypothetical protein
MHAVKFVISAGVIIAGLLSGVFWVRAAYAKVAAKPGANEGVGYGGSLVNVRDHNGAVVDFLFGPAVHSAPPEPRGGSAGRSASPRSAY